MAKLKGKIGENQDRRQFDNMVWRDIYIRNVWKHMRQRLCTEMMTSIIWRGPCKGENS